MHTVRNFEAPETANSYWNWLEGSNLFWVYFLKITPQGDWANLSTIGFTSYDSPLNFAAHPGVTFNPTAGLNPMAAETELGEAPNLEMDSIFETNVISEADLLVGKYNNARVEYWRMNGDEFKMGEELLSDVVLARFRDFQDFYKAEMVGRSDILNTNFLDYTTRVCRCVKTFNQFPGDCSYNAATSGGFQNQRTVAVDTVTDRTHVKLVRSADDVPDDFYTNGTIECITGDNQGIKREIQVATGVGTGTIDAVLKRAFPMIVDDTDTYKLTVGCSGTLARCQYFGNVINRQAEDWVPTFEKAATRPPVPS